MRIPLDHFSSVPVFALSPPGTSPEPETHSGGMAASIKEKMSSLASDLSVFYNNSSVGSAPSSPLNQRKNSIGPASLPVFTSQGPSCATVSRYGPASPYDYIPN